MDSNIAKPESSSKGDASNSASEALMNCIQSHHIPLPSDLESGGSGTKTTLFSGGVEVADKSTFLWFTSDPQRRFAEEDHFRNDGNSYEFRSGHLPNPGLFRLGADGAKVQVPAGTEEFESAQATLHAINFKQARCKS